MALQSSARILLAAATLFSAAALLATSSAYRSVTAKFSSIEHRKVKPGSVVKITADELNAYVQEELPEWAPEGVSDPSVDLPGVNRATGRVLVDFLRIRSAQGKSNNWLLRNLLRGKHELAVTVGIRSAGSGQAVIDIERVEVAGLPVDGPALDFLIQNYLIPNYPEAKVGKPFSLGPKVDRIEVTRGVAHVRTR